MTISRRASLKLMAASSLVFAPGRLFPAKSSDFWNTEDPSQWTHEQIQQLTTDSPWAKPVTAQVQAYSTQSPNSVRGGGRRMGRSSGSSTASTNLPKFPGVVRWLSAKPMLLALKLQLPPGFEHHYVIGVSGLPVVSGHGEGADNTDSYDALKESTYLQTKGQEPAQPGVIQADPTDTSTLLFGFLNQFLDLSSAKTATFSSEMNPLSVKVKFDLARMVYKGQLAV
jgi:hypothetical protein